MYRLVYSMAASTRVQGQGGQREGGESHIQSSPIPPEVVKKTRAVLLSCTKGVLLKRFSKDYANLAGMY